MLEISNNLFWSVVSIIVFVYVIFVLSRKIIYAGKQKLKVKYKEESIVNMEIVNKKFLRGKTSYIGACKFVSRTPDSYFLELRYKDEYYKINDKELFEYFQVGESISIKLVIKKDKNNNVIGYELDYYF